MDSPLVPLDWSGIVGVEWSIAGPDRRLPVGATGMGAGSRMASLLLTVLETNQSFALALSSTSVIFVEIVGYTGTEWEAQWIQD